MDNLRLSAVADRVVAWHNRHPLARRISAAQVHAIGYVALPFTGEAPPAPAPSAAQAAAQAIAAAAAAPLPVLTDVAAAAMAQSPAEAQNSAEGSRLRERALIRAREQAADPHAALAADTAAAVLATLAPATLKRNFSQNFIDTLTARQAARFALKHGRVLARAPLDAPVREVLADALQPDRRQRVPAQVYLLTAVIETDTRKSRVLLGLGSAVLGRRIHSSPRLATLLAVAAGVVGTPLWLMQPQRAAPPALPGSAPASLPAVLPAVAPVAEPVVAPMPAAASAAVAAPPAAEAPRPVPMIEPPAPPPASPAETPASTRRRMVSIVPTLSDGQKALAREQRRALMDAAAAAPPVAPVTPVAPAAPVASAPSVASASRLPSPATPAAAIAAPAMAAPPTGPVFAISTRALRTRAEADQVRVAMQSLLQTLGHAELQVDVLPQGDDWRVVALPFAQRAAAEKGRTLLVSRGMRVAVVDF